MVKLKHYPIEKLKKEIRQIVGKHLDLKKYKIFFFGSRVRGDSFERADIDIGIEGPREISAKIKLEIEEEINQLPTLYKFDIVDFKQVSKKFKKEALKYVEEIN